MPSFSLGNYGGLLAAPPASSKYPQGASVNNPSSNLQMPRDALLLQEAVDSKRDAEFGHFQRQRELGAPGNRSAGV